MGEKMKWRNKIAVAEEIIQNTFHIIQNHVDGCKPKARSHPAGEPWAIQDVVSLKYAAPDEKVVNECTLAGPVWSGEDRDSLLQNR